MTTEIRPAKPADASMVGDLARASYSMYVERMGREPAPMLDDYASLIARGDVWVMTVNGEIFGVLVMRSAEDHLFVGNVAVRPDQQGKGFARRMMDFAEQEARRNGLREIRLYTNEKMSENLAIYEKLGFEETGRRLDGGYRRVFMRKRLT